MAHQALGRSLIDERPPSTAITFAVTKVLSSDKSQKMAAATSLGSAIRPSGWKAVDALRAISLFVIASVIGVLVSPGATALMRMPLLA